MKSPQWEAQKWQKESSLGAKFAIRNHTVIPCFRALWTLGKYD